MGDDLAALRPVAPALRPHDLLEAVADAYGIEARAVQARTRTRGASMARQTLYFVLHDVCGWRPCEIAAMMQRSHSTISYGVARARAVACTSDGAVMMTAVRAAIVARHAQSMRTSPPH